MKLHGTLTKGDVMTALIDAVRDKTGFTDALITLDFSHEDSGLIAFTVDLEADAATEVPTVPTVPTVPPRPTVNERRPNAQNTK